DCGTTIWDSTVSIQNVACMVSACAFGPGPGGGALISPSCCSCARVSAEGSPSKKAMLSAPPPNRGVAGFVVMEIVVVDTIVWDAPLVDCATTTSFSNVFGLSSSC